MLAVDNVPLAVQNAGCLWYVPTDFACREFCPLPFTVMISLRMMNMPLSVNICGKYNCVQTRLFLTMLWGINSHCSSSSEALTVQQVFYHCTVYNLLVPFIGNIVNVKLYFTIHELPRSELTFVKM